MQVHQPEHFSLLLPIGTAIALMSADGELVLLPRAD